MRTYAQQKAGITRADNRLKKAYYKPGGGVNDLYDPEVATAVRKAAAQVHAECVKVLREWNDSDRGYWPDDWHRWNIALSDAGWAYRRAGGTSRFPDALDDLRV